jgi:CelD/BcsL family acetyltransferase involved in cellulose biosynthesis
VRAPPRIETISSEAGLGRVSGEWDELVRSMPRPSPFLLHGWISEWWRHYGEGATLAVHVARRGDRLVGALPLCRRRRFGMTVTEFVGGARGALLADLMVSDGENGDTAALLAARLAESSGDFADLFGIPAQSRLAAALPTGSLALVERLEAPVLDLADGWETVYETHLTSKARSDRRRRRRQLEGLGAVEVSVARTPTELVGELDDAFRLHALRWHGRRDTSGLGCALGRSFQRAALLRLAVQDVPRLVTLRLDGRAIAFALYLQLGSTIYGLRMAFDPAYARLAPGTETLLCTLERAAAEGVTRVEFLGAAAEHKQRFTDRLDPIHQGIGLASSLRGRAAVMALTRGIRVRRRFKRSHAAQWLYYRVPRLGRG